MLLLCPSQTLGLGINYEAAWEKQLKIIIAAHPRYVWGGAEDETKGLDCSGYLYLSARRAGFPVHRTTALHMRAGGGGWLGVDIMFRDSRQLDIVWWTFSQGRPHGHVGILIRHPVHGIPAVTHASSKRGVVVDYVAGRLLGDLSATRRLKIGDP